MYALPLKLKVKTLRPTSYGPYDRCDQLSNENLRAFITEIFVTAAQNNEGHKVDPDEIITVYEGILAYEHDHHVTRGRAVEAIFDAEHYFMDDGFIDEDMANAFPFTITKQYLAAGFHYHDALTILSAIRRLPFPCSAKDPRTYHRRAASAAHGFLSIAQLIFEKEDYLDTQLALSAVSLWDVIVSTHLSGNDEDTLPLDHLRAVAFHVAINCATAARAVGYTYEEIVSLVKQYKGGVIKTLLTVCDQNDAETREVCEFLLQQQGEIPPIFRGNSNFIHAITERHRAFATVTLPEMVETIKQLEGNIQSALLLLAWTQNARDAERSIRTQTRWKVTTEQLLEGIKKVGGRINRSILTDALQYIPPAEIEQSLDRIGDIHYPLFIAACREIGRKRAEVLWATCHPKTEQQYHCLLHLRRTVTHLPLIRLHAYAQASGWDPALAVRIARAACHGVPALWTCAHKHEEDIVRLVTWWHLETLLGHKVNSQEVKSICGLWDTPPSQRQVRLALRVQPHNH